MADPNRGRGRGLALLQALKKSQTQPDTTEASPDSTPEQSVAPSNVSSISGATASTLGGRGRITAMMMSKMHTQAAPTYQPASDVGPSAPPTTARGVGRGIKLLQNLKAAQSAASSVAPEPPVTAASTVSTPAIESVTKTMGETSISSKDTSAGRNKYFREIKDTPPVVMKGETGAPCEVTANFVYLEFEENSVYEYEVRYTPDQDYKNLRFKLLNEHSHHFTAKVFDGTTLYTPHKLPDEALNLVSTSPFDNSKVQLSIIFRRPRRLSEMIHIYNVLFKNIMKDLQLVRFNRQHFSQKNAVQIPQYKLEVWPGYVTAVDEYEGGLMLTLDSTSRVLRTENVLNYIKEVTMAQGDWKRTVNDNLVGCSVMTTYNQKLFRVDSIDHTMTPKSTFEKKEAGQVIHISYIDYYKKNYGIDIMDWNQPMLISRETKHMAGSETPTDFMICLVPELCQLTGLSESQRSNFQLMKAVAVYTRITPNQRHAAFRKYIENVLNNESAVKRLSAWGLKIAQKTIDITARTLPPEAISFGRNVRIPGKATAEWNFDVCKNAVITAIDVTRWAIFYTNKDTHVTKDFIETMKRCSGPMGINVLAPSMHLLPNDRTDTFTTFLKKTITQDLQLVVCICPTMRDDRYTAIKRICCNEKPVASQVINARTISNQQKLRAITQKILLQINCKLGGTLWSIAIPLKTTMIVGIDSYHDPNRKNRSICGFIASYNQSHTQWYSRAVFQERGQEIVDGLKSCLVDSLTHYMKINGLLPTRIIVYRDGVGDGQFNVIKNYEVEQLKICVRSLDDTYQPTITYVVVQKRINTRIFMKSDKGLENPFPGTIVDHKITRRDWYDFLIVSQKVGQGTVTPTHYVVVYDDNKMSPDQCQRLTYKLCHLYYNWPGTVRVPAPCQYAHKLAYLIGEHTKVEHSDSLRQKLFFL